MRFEPLVRSHWTFSCACYKCAKPMQSDHDNIWCDLDGPAFRAYYCEGCKDYLTDLLVKNPQIKRLELWPH